MKVFKTNAKRLAVFLLAVLLLCTSGILPAFAAKSDDSDKKGNETTSLEEIKALLTDETYASYLALHPDAKDASQDVVIDVMNYLKDETTTDIVKLDKLGDYKGSVLVTGESGRVSWKVNIPETANYAIEIEYYTAINVESDEISIKSKTSSPERMLVVDGKILFEEARSIELTKSWIDAYTLTDDYELSDGTVLAKDTVLRSDDPNFWDVITNEINIKESDKNGVRIFSRDYSAETYDKVPYEERNEMRPTKVEKEEWRTEYLTDSSGYLSKPFKFYLEKGEHTISLDSVREPLAIKSIRLYSYEEPASYEEYLQKHADKKDATVAPIILQAEYPTGTSSQTIYQLADTTSPITQPSHSSRERLNTIGGDKWQYAGDWIKWTVKIEEDGFYDIIPRSIQNFYSGTYVSRQLLVDGEVPFEEASRLRFNYSTSWMTNKINAGVKDENGNLVTYKVYLSKGVHEITLKVVLGDMGELLSLIEDSLATVNDYRRKLLMVTGPSPDEYRDYNFDKSMPNVLRGFKAQAKLLTDISAQLEEIIGAKGDHTVILDKTAWILETMGTKPTKIASLMDDLKDQIGSLGTWLMNSQNQPLIIDYIAIQAPSSEAPQADANFFQAAWAEIQKFIVSFFADYNTVGAKTKDEYNESNSIDVWITTGRDNAKIIRTMINDYFIADTNIPTNLKLVAAGTLLPATLAGTGPDVSLGSGSSDAINYAIRSAVISLNQFDDLDALDQIIYEGNIPTDGSYYQPDSFSEVMNRFSSSAAVPLTLYGQTYGVPENQSFPMLFYRKDIFVELGIEVPRTWDDFYNAIYKLQANQLDIGFPTGVGGSTIWMYQLGETMYKMGNYEEYAEKLLKMYPEETVKEMLKAEKIANAENLSYMDGLVALNKFYKNADGEYIPNTDGMEINLGSDTALACFKDVCELFTMWQFPATYDFANRFRSGEMPMAIADYTAYNQLVVFAPEIKGLWEFTTLPGYVVDDKGTINFSSVPGVSCSIMMRGVEDANASDKENALRKKNAWAFMSWWSGSQAQSKYATEMEALLGPSAKQATANLEALYNMPWSTSEYENLRTQFDNLVATPEFPGSYILGRYTNFAFLAVYNDGDEPVDSLQSYIEDINKELSRKRKEFGLPVAEDFKNLETETTVE